MAKRPSKEIITLLSPGIPTKQSKTSNFQEQPDDVSTINPWSSTQDSYFKLRRKWGAFVREGGSCVLKASVDRVSVDTIGRYGDRHSADISTDTRPICRPRLGHVSVDMNRQACRPILHCHSAATQLPLGSYSAATRPILNQHSANTKLSWSALATAGVLSSLLYWERLSVAVVLFGL